MSDPPSYPNYPPPSGYGPPPPPRRSNAMIWVGIACVLPYLIVTSGLAAAVGAVDDSGALSGLVGLAAFVGPLVMLFFERVRKFALGLIIGFAVLFILAAGACVALLAAYN